MNVLLLSSRFPWPPHSGDRVRAEVWLEALRGSASVALVAPPGEVPRSAPPFRFYPLRRSLRSAAMAGLRFIAGAPAQSVLSGVWDWRTAIDAATSDCGSFDATIVLLSRLAPAVSGMLPRGQHILDAIDPLSQSMQERARASRVSRWLWRAEARRLDRLEQTILRSYDDVIVVNGDDGYGTAAISNGVAVAPLGNAARTIDFAFWGRLGFFANADAAAWLIREIWPAIRQQRPSATLLIAGADAPAFVRAAAGREGIRVLSPAGDMKALARSTKIALLPLRFGTGESTKALEAAEAGCAIVATPKGVRGSGAVARHAFVGGDTETLVRLAVEALDDHSRREAAAARLRAAVEQFCDREHTLERLAAIVRRGKAAA